MAPTHRPEFILTPPPWTPVAACVNVPSMGGRLGLGPQPSARPRSGELALITNNRNFSSKAIGLANERSDH